MQVCVQVCSFKQCHEEHHDVSYDNLDVSSNEEALFCWFCLVARVLVDCPFEDLTERLHNVFLGDQSQQIAAVNLVTPLVAYMLGQVG